ncbi:MAG TPA: hypothetical protein VLL97_02315 [Acidobacteriota bacterium]|nr:hypothetical protein [Acidobacteriota bacterium]
MRKRWLVVLFACIFGSSVVSQAVTPRFWEHFTQEDLLRGTLENISVSPGGALALAPIQSLIADTGQPHIFSMVRDSKGNIYAGTGDEGKVFKIDPQGAASIFFQSEELNIFAMALDASDRLYVGTSPDGKVYRVDGPNQAAVVFSPEAKYIWSMVFDDDGNLYVGTGAGGVIHKVDRAGKPSVFYTCNDSHVRSMLWQRGKLLAGTSPGGMIVEITPEGRGFVLMESLLEEVHSLAVDRFGVIYAAASSSRNLVPAASPAASGSSGVTVVASATVASAAVADSPGAAAGRQQTLREREAAGARTAIYAITENGDVETFYSSGARMVYDLAVRGDGTIIAATGSKGRLLNIDGARQVTVIADFTEEDTTRLIVAGDVIYAATGNQGNVYRIQTGKAETGTYTSQPLDAGVVSSWGTLSWDAAATGTAAVEFSTRTGNTMNTDNSWSDWSVPYTRPGQQITSPRARYLQWRAVFKGSSPPTATGSAGALSGVRISYLQQNIRPRVTELEALPYGVELQKQPSLGSGSLTGTTASTTTDGRSLIAPRERGRERQPLPPRQALQAGVQSFTWNAVDENDDTLEYALYFRGEGESDWKLLENELTDTFYTLDTASLPDGVYRLKVVASDRPSNPYNRYLIGEKISKPFVIAGATPNVGISGHEIKGRRVEVRFTAEVTKGNVATAEFSINGGEWLLIFPVDGIADSAGEEYRFVTPDLSPGEHLIGVRASDRNGTTGSAGLVVRVP